jgi:fluoride exporter
MLILAVALGGALGAISRFALAGWVYRRTSLGFPWGILAVNLLGCLLLGVVVAVLPAEAGTLRGLLVVGCLGGFTTFSTFAYDAVGMLEDEKPSRALVYVVVSVVLGIAAVAIGLAVAQ